MSIFAATTERGKIIKTLALQVLRRWQMRNRILSSAALWNFGRIACFLRMRLASGPQ
jgi:hypothetical protein